MPKAYWSCEIVGKVTTEAAKETGLAKGTPVITGTTDAAAEALSAGVVGFGDMMLMFGSSIFFVMKTMELVKTQHFWTSNFLEKNTYVFAGGMSTSGSLTKWFRDQFAQLEVGSEKSGGKNAYDALDEIAAKSTIGAKGLIMLPYFEGERTPLHDPKAKGVLFGLSLKHTRKDVYRAILEGVGFGIYHNLEVMNEEGIKPKRILAVGGGTKNANWMQIVSDIVNVELVIPKQQIGASYGDAFMAGVGVGLFKSINEINRWVKIKRIVKPNLKAHDKYALNYKIFCDLYKSTKSLMHELSDSLTNQSI
ncbi:Xylulose kinase [subsurface metagenome]